ncbi:hypothetical protein BDW59DRAFT_155339 [Aspergillus cavernicola]|uniref:Uncharacterized protein n=1 Tax=Aspergillus cavernicola TaxID=176166 RepID=A0ABR4HAG9_9EURO
MENNQSRDESLGLVLRTDRSPQKNLKRKREEDESWKLIPWSLEEFPRNPTDLKSLDHTSRILPVPTDDDDLMTTVIKMRDLADVVRQRDSLASWTGMKLESTPQDVETDAIELMHPTERMMYGAWKEKCSNAGTIGNVNDEDEGKDKDKQKGFRVPEFDWVANVAPIPGGPKSVKKFAQRAAAMDIVFGHQGATPENAAWLTFNMLTLLPLVTAVNKVSNMTRHSREHGNSRVRGVCALGEAEMQTVQGIVAAAEKNLNREMRRFRAMKNEILESVRVMQSRKQSLEARTLEES